MIIKPQIAFVAQFLFHSAKKRADLLRQVGDWPDPTLRTESKSSLFAYLPSPVASPPVVTWLDGLHASAV